MLMDVFSFSVGGFVGTVIGFLTCSLLVVSKDADKRMGCEQ